MILPQILPFSLHRTLVPPLSRPPRALAHDTRLVLGTPSFLRTPRNLISEKWAHFLLRDSPQLAFWFNLELDDNPSTRSKPGVAPEHDITLILDGYPHAVAVGSWLTLSRTAAVFVAFIHPHINRETEHPLTERFGLINVPIATVKFSAFDPQEHPCLSLRLPTNPDLEQLWIESFQNYQHTVILTYRPDTTQYIDQKYSIAPVNSITQILTRATGEASDGSDEV